ncbi:hypothetical protein HanIR_Chr06g0265481 [Helianthus annuus]|nr:hypothetical protein HanIR_Chr06g0265481 [Helianthus annuus]
MTPQTLDHLQRDGSSLRVRVEGRPDLSRKEPSLDLRYQNLSSFNLFQFYHHNQLASQNRQFTFPILREARFIQWE